MGRRQQLQNLLSGIPEVKKAYFQASENTKMEYPCIVYEKSLVQVQHADNLPFRRTTRYQVTVIDTNPDSEIPDKIEAMPLCSFDRHFVSANLHHTVYQLYF